MKILPYGRQSIDEKDRKAVYQALKSDWITQGPTVLKFEKKLADFCGAKYAVAVSSGTAALHLAAMAVNIKKGTEAITSPITFLSTSNAAIYCGAKPVFADIDSQTGNIDPQDILKKINKKTKAIIPVHLGGRPCEMEEINQIARKNKLAVIEDAAHALGTQYRIGRQWFKVGSCSHSDMTCFSFHPCKLMTTGEGGAITTNNKKIYQRLLGLRTHGVYKDAKALKNGPWYYEMRELGYNFRLCDVQCALGIEQLRKINRFIQQRRNIAAEYNRVFSGNENFTLISESVEQKSAYHLYILLVDFKKLKTSRIKMMKQFRNKGIITQVHYIPVYRQPYYRKTFGNQIGKFPGSEKYYQQCLTIPIYPSMTTSDINRVIHAVNGVIR